MGRDSEWEGNCPEGICPKEKCPREMHRGPWKKWGKIAVLGPYNKNMDPGALPKGALFYSPVDFTDASDLNTLMQV